MSSSLSSVQSQRDKETMAGYTTRKSAEVAKDIKLTAGSSPANSNGSFDGPNSTQNMIEFKRRAEQILDPRLDVARRAQLCKDVAWIALSQAHTETDERVTANAKYWIKYAPHF